jgi:hypothetical protein
MKVNFIKSIIAITLSGLIAYGFYSFHISENKLLLSAGSFVFVALTLILTIGISFDLSRTSINVRTVSAIFFLVAMTSNIIFLFVSFSVPLYIISNGILILLYTLITYSILRTKQ